MSTNTRLLTASPEAVEEFQEQGYLILRGFFEPEVVEQAREAAAAVAEKHIALLLREGKISRTYSEEPFETRLIRVYEECSQEISTVFRPELHEPGFFRMFFNRYLLDVVSGLLGPEIRLYPNYSLRSKLPDNEATLVLWHQDAGYTDNVHRSEAGSAADLRMVNIWSPLVPATVENGCMQFIPGTNKLGVVRHEQRNKFYLEIAQDVLEPLLNRAVNVEVDPGDVVLFSNLMFHRGLPNRSKAIRWSADWRYQDATQSTLRPEKGHIARSRTHPDQVVKSAQQWTELSFT